MLQGLNGSTIKSWFQYRCERKTRYELMTPEELAAVPVGKDEREQSWAVLGIDYENRVVARLARSTGVLRHRPGGDCLSDGLTDQFLRGSSTAEYAAQVNLRPKSRPAFLEHAPDITLRRTFADLIRREPRGGSGRFTVIDIKATRAARAFHKTQVAYYAILLEAVLKERGIPGSISATGEIWQIAEDGDASGDRHVVEEFALAPYRRLVEEFASRSLPGIAKRQVRPGRDDTFFHIYFKCEQCHYLSHCMSSIAWDLEPRSRDVSAVPGLSHESKRTLLANGVATVGDLAAQGLGLGKIDGAGWSLSRKTDQLIRRAKAIVADEVLPGPDEQTFLMPPRTDVSVFLVADHDPVDDGLVTLGFLISRDGGERDLIRVLPDAGRRAEADALVEVFGALVAELEAVDLHNAALSEDDSAALQAHIFLYEPTEAIALQNAVKRHLDDPRIRSGLLHLVRLFPPEDIVPEPEFRGMNHLPATALRTVCEQLVAVPAVVSYDLRQVSQALTRAGRIERSYEPTSAFERPFSSMLSLEVSRRMRERKPGHALPGAIADDVRSRLRASASIATWLQAENTMRVASGARPLLRLAKKPFRLQASFDPIEAGDLDVIKALELLENRAGMLDTLVRLAKPPRTRRDVGGAIGPLRLLRVHRNQRTRTFVLRRAPEARNADIPGAGFGVVLSDGSPELLLDPRRWPDLGVALLAPAPGDGPDIIRVRVWEKVFQGATIQRLMRDLGQDGWWLDQTFVDVNSQKAADFISYLAAGQAA